MNLLLIVQSHLMTVSLPRSSDVSYSDVITTPPLGHRSPRPSELQISFPRLSSQNMVTISSLK